MSGQPAEQTKAFRALAPNGLLKSQKTAAHDILGKILDIVAANQDRKPEDDIQRPHQVFCVDGGRGAGKTYCLLSLEHALKVVSSQAAFDLDGPDSSARRAAKPEERRELNWADRLNGGNGRLAGLLQRSGERGRPILVHPLRLIFPGDMEQEEVLMETIFAGLWRDIEEQLEKRKSEEEFIKKGKVLQKDLVDKVAQGWYFARRFGVEAVIKDSMDFAGLVKNFDRLNRLASHRITAWRDFVDDYLKWRGVGCLAILLDDSDVSPELTFNILHCIRTFLNHPRIVTVLAGNIRAMRDSLVHINMRRLSKSVRALNSQSNTTAADWRRAERLSIEQYLEKVLPEAKRYFLVKPMVEDDYRQVANEALLEICAGQSKHHEGPFDRAKFQLAVEYELDGADRPNDRQTRDLEDYLSWWLYSTRYLPALAPRSARQAQSFGEFYALPKAGEVAVNSFAQPSKKRLPVMLFTNPANYGLVQRFGDDDPNVTTWLIRQDIKAQWVGVRSFEISGRKAPEGSYTYDYIRYRIDLGLTLPLRNNGEAMPPQALLPVIRGRRRMRRFFHPRTLTRQIRKIGVARWLDHAALPDNCMCFYDLVGLPDRAFVDMEAVRKEEDRNRPNDQWRILGGGDWEAQLWANWPELFDDNPDALDILRYFTEVVCERLRTENRGIRTGSLLRLLGAAQPDKALDQSYSKFLTEELKMFGKADTWADADRASELAKAALTHSDPPPRKASQPGETLRDEPPREMIEDGGAWVARYSALATDLRRAWHAICIHEATLRANRSADSPLAFNVDGQAMIGMMANAERIRLYRLDDLMGVINQDPWMKGMFRAFTREALGSLYKKKTPDDRFSLEDLFDPPIGSGAEAVEDEKNYVKWIRSWRQFGRLTCAEWPVRPKELKAKEDELFSKSGVDPDLRLDLRPKENSSLSPTAGQSDGKNQDGERIVDAMRSARDFVWLIFGLAPSLPAVIHAEIAGILYNGPPRDMSDDPVALKAWEADRLMRLNRADERLRAWLVFVAQSTAILRYVRTKCLSLHTATAIKALDLADLENPSRMQIYLKRALATYSRELKLNPYLSEAGRQALEFHGSDHVLACKQDGKLKNPSNLEQFLKSGSGEDKNKSAYIEGGKSISSVVSAVSADIEKPKEWMGRINQLFKDAKGDDRIDPSKRMMPDFSAATLFGPHWLLGLAKRYIEPDGLELPAGRQPGDSSTEGTFGETEHWLWGAHAMLIQARNCIAEAKK